jgi:hypothetical protein
LSNRIIILMLFSLITTGCATLEPPPAKTETSFFLARYDKVLETAVRVLENQTIPVQSSNKEKGIITTRFVNYSMGEKAHHDMEKIAYKPDVFLALYTQVRYSYTIQVIPMSGMSMQVKIAATIEAYDQNVTHKWHACVSKNVLERKLLEQIRAEL